MTQEKHVREQLERALSKTFSDVQWGLIAAQGYEEDIVSGQRSLDDVALELRDLMDAAGRGETVVSLEGEASPTWVDRPVSRGKGSTLTWEEMERLVLGRTLAADQTGPSGSSGGPLDVAPRLSRLAADRARARRRWWIILGSGLVVLAIGLVVALLVGGLQCSAASEAGGTLELTFSKDGETVRCVLDLVAVEDLAGARLRMGLVFTGVAADRAFDADDFVGALQGKTMADLRALLGWRH